MKTTTANENNIQSEVKQFWLSSIGVTLLTTLYLLFIILAVRNRLWVEISISLLFPIFMLVTKRARYFFTDPVHYVMKRVKQLVVFESLYNLIVIISLIAILAGNATTNRLASWAFVGFFVLQAGGFFAAQIQRKKPHGILQSAILVSCILFWWYNTTDPSGVIDEQGRFLMWGEDAPFAVKLIYTIWALNGLLADTTVLPRLTQAIVHLVSIALCWWSAEFFHVRLLTACHLFLLDGIFAYSFSDPLGKRICVMPEAYFDSFKKYIQPYIPVLCSASILVIVVISLLKGGLNMGF